MDRIGTVNVSGWSTKKHLVANLLSKQNIAILAINETKTNPNSKMKVPRYCCFRKDSVGHCSGGVAFLTHESLTCVPLALPTSLTSNNILGITVKLSSGNINLITAYLQRGDEHLPELLEFTSNIAPCVLLGDLNARHFDFGDFRNNKNGITLMNNLQILPLHRIHNTSYRPHNSN